MTLIGKKDFPSQDASLVQTSDTRASFGDKLSVLILDDDHAVAETINAMASSLGADSRFTCCASDFFAEFTRRPPDVAIIDLLMPDHDGLEVMRELGSRHGVQAILSSGCDVRVLDTARLSARSHGLDVIGTLPKPVRRSALKAALQTVRMKGGAQTQKSDPEDASTITPEMLRRGLAEGQIVAHFQPKIRLSDRKPCGFEALARWEHPALGMVMPDVFIPLVGEAGLDFDLSEVMLDQALAYLADLVEMGETELSVAVNVPMQVCADPTFLELLETLLDRHQLSPAHLILEVTEAGGNGIEQLQIDALTRLSLNGFALSIDDFGTGVSSLERLVRIPFNELKIDRYFARDISTSRRSKGLVRNLVQMAKTLGMSVTIEGIEDSRSMQLSTELGCDNVQGYHVARPMSAKMARGWTAEHAGRGWASPA